MIRKGHLGRSLTRTTQAWITWNSSELKPWLSQPSIHFQQEGHQEVFTLNCLFFKTGLHVAQAGHKLIMYQKKKALTLDLDLLACIFPVLGLQAYATHTWLYSVTSGLGNIQYDHCMASTRASNSSRMSSAL